MLIGEGTNIWDIPEVDQYLEPGQVFELQLTMMEPVDEATLSRLENEFIRYGFQPQKIYPEGNIIHIQLQKLGEGEVGLAWFVIPAIIGGAGLFGLFSWKVVTMDPWEMLVKSIPFLVIGGGAIYLVTQLLKSPVVEKVITK